MADTIAKIFGMGASTTSDAALRAAERAAALQRSRESADQAEAEQRRALTLSARGRRGLLAFMPSELSDTLG